MAKIIKTLGNYEKGTIVSFHAILSYKNVLKTKSGDDYLLVEFQDASGKITFPVWKGNAQKMHDSLELGKPYRVDGFVDFYKRDGAAKEEVQVREPSITLIEDKIFDYKEFVPSYTIGEEVIRYIDNIINSLAEPYKQLAVTALGWKDEDNERYVAFMNCPSASKHHGNKIGGLFLHTAGVVRNVEAIINDYVTKPYLYDASALINWDRLIFKALIHDICKTEEYEWFPIIARKQIPLTHVEMGPGFIAKINEECGKLLSDEEICEIGYSILCHHGEWGNYPIKTIEDMILHFADCIDGKIVNCIQNGSDVLT